MCIYLLYVLVAVILTICPVNAEERQTLADELRLKRISEQIRKAEAIHKKIVQHAQTHARRDYYQQEKEIQSHLDEAIKELKPQDDNQPVVEQLTKFLKTHLTAKAPLQVVGFKLDKLKKVKLFTHHRISEKLIIAVAAIGGKNAQNRLISTLKGLGPGVGADVLYGGFAAGVDGTGMYRPLAEMQTTKESIEFVLENFAGFDTRNNTDYGIVYLNNNSVDPSLVLEVLLKKFENHRKMDPNVARKISHGSLRFLSSFFEVDVYNKTARFPISDKEKLAEKDQLALTKSFGKRLLEIVDTMQQYVFPNEKGKATALRLKHRIIDLMGGTKGASAQEAFPRSYTKRKSPNHKFNSSVRRPRL